MKPNNLILPALIALVAYLYIRSRQAAQDDIPDPTDQIRPPTYSSLPPVVETEKNAPRVAGYFPSELPGARPEMPYGVRWGGIPFGDTTLKAKMVL